MLREANRRRLRGFGFVVWLTADPAELARRLEADRSGLAGRPSLTAAGTLGEIAQVLAARSPLYAGLADAVIPTDGKEPRRGGRGHPPTLDALNGRDRTVAIG